MQVALRQDKAILFINCPSRILPEKHCIMQSQFVMTFYGKDRVIVFSFLAMRRGVHLCMEEAGLTTNIQPEGQSDSSASGLLRSVRSWVSPFAAFFQKTI
jgi:hypothetical protein